ncbi:MAG TPA: glycosyltransferase [Pyrinomonadaceae bacterium]|jgi:glycosyltransferase involved in cell wall biosynthesis
MHVLQLGPYPPPEGGISRNYLAIREQLRRADHKCSVIAIAKSSKIVPEPDVYHPRSPLELIRLLFRLDYDVLHLHIGGEIPLRVLSLMAVCGVLAKGKNVLTLHSGGYAAENARRAKYFSRAGFVFRLYRKVIGVNPLMLELFEKFGVKKDRAHLIRPFFHQKPDESVKVPPRLKEFAEKSNPFLLTVCLLEEAYDLFMQVDAMEKVLEKLPNSGLMIIGSGSLEEKLKAAIAEKPYKNRVFLTGDVPHAVTLHLINRADILLRTTVFDGDAIAVREALFLETPVIATDNGMRPEGVHPIPMRDAESLIEKIEFLAKREKKPKTEKADDWSNISAVLKIYDEILERNSGKYLITHRESVK